MLYRFDPQSKSFAVDNSQVFKIPKILTNPVSGVHDAHFSHNYIPGNTALVAFDEACYKDTEVVLEYPLLDPKDINPRRDLSMFPHPTVPNLYTTGEIKVPLSGRDMMTIAKSHGYYDVDISVRTQVWYAPAGTECGIHNTHEFHEYHVQLMGYGRMERFAGDDNVVISSHEELSPGSAQAQIYAINRGGYWSYPWHQYNAQTDCVWAAIETEVLYQ